MAELIIHSYNRTGLLVDISKVFTEREIDIITMNSRINKKGVATLTLSFRTRGKDELARLIEKIRQIDGIFDIKRSTG